jgi:CDP-diacylglycerol---glycerol-3-phosphate 3-phosphatidyltransferase
MNIKTTIPAAISSLRLAALPLFFIFFVNKNLTANLALLALCAATDFLDGYMARKLNVSSQFGAYFDASTDFTLMFGAYIIFTLYGFYPFWLPLLIATSFALFLATSRLSKKIYDPVGKYTGSALYIGVVLTLVFPVWAVLGFVQFAFLVYFLVSLASRTVSILKNRKNNQTS